MEIYKSQSGLESIVVNPGSNVCDATVIWLHGLGADAEDFVGVVDQLGLPRDHSIRFIFPNAPFRSITINGNMIMRGWYDIFALELNTREDVVGVKQAQQQIHELIQQQLDHGIAGKKVILAGFSQGGAVALYTSLRYPVSLGGIVALSAYQVLADTLVAERCGENADVPIFMGHGMFDPVVPFSLGQQSYEQLVALNYSVRWMTYPMQHTVNLQEIEHIGCFVRDILL